MDFFFLQYICVLLLLVSHRPKQEYEINQIKLFCIVYISGIFHGISGVHKKEDYLPDVSRSQKSLKWTRKVRKTATSCACPSHSHNGTMHLWAITPEDRGVARLRNLGKKKKTAELLYEV